MCDDQYQFMYRDASNSIAHLDQKLAAYRDLIEVWQLVAQVMADHPVHHRKCKANNNVTCDRCTSLAMFQEAKRVTDAIL